MFCSKCGISLPEDSQFCRKCGQAQSVSTGGGAAAAVAPAPIKAAPPKRGFAIWILVPFLLLIVGWAVWQMNVHGYYGAAQTDSRQQLPPKPPPPQLHTQSTGDVAITLSAGGASHYTFTATAGAYDVKLKGHFSAMGGSRDDIVVFVMSEDNYVNWQHSHSVSTFYNSDRVTQDSINLSLPSDAGTYYVVFSNQFSFLSPKAVQANLSLTYYTRQ